MSRFLVFSNNKNFVGGVIVVFLSKHTTTPSFEDYEQAYIVHTGFAG